MTHIKCHQMMYNGAGSGSLGAGHRSADVFLQYRPFNGASFFVAMICLVRLLDAYLNRSPLGDSLLQRIANVFGHTRKQHRKRI